MALHRRFVTWVMAAAVLAGGCGDAASTYRSVIRDQTKAFEELEQILSTVTHPPSMTAAQALFKKKWDRCEAVKERALDLPPPTTEIRELVYEESVNLRQIFAKVEQHIGRIKALPGGEDFLKHAGRTP